ncbi:reticulon-1b isoform X2 [Clupea harengus]|uniref:Reticulon n=1 Tax=Clupea harengus TaxID=7950 RepID=A0A6P8GD34_CLUHA|nr:reticulon-1b isoform X2 [Clupea harengus]
MSVKPSEEPSSEAGWFGDDFEKIDRFGSNVAQFDDLDGQRMKDWEDETSEQKQFSHHPESNRQPLPVVMETASTDKSEPLKKSSDMDDLYTSLLSNQSYSFQKDPPSTYFSGSAGGKSTGGGGSGGSGGGGGLMDDLMSGLDSHTMFSSDSGIEMTPGDPSDLTSSRKLSESDRGVGAGAGGVTSDYSYMDISRPQQQQQHSPLDDDDWGSISSKPGDFLSGLGDMGGMGASSAGGNAGGYMEKGGSGSGVAGGAGAGAGVETLGPALDAQSFPYVEEPSDEELSDYQPYRSPGAGSSASPVKITLTETPPRSPSPNAPMAVSERESILSLGLEGMPTVTLSEPEDDSPGSSTPPFPDDSPSDHKSGDSKSFSPDKTPAPKQPSPAEKPMPPMPPMPSSPSSGSAYPRSPNDAEGSSGGESGDSEIELVTEEPTAAAFAHSAASSYMSFSKPSAPAPTPTPAPALPPSLVSAPPPSSAATLNQYSILREEREAELDSELAMESCGEESPQRGLHHHEAPAPKGPRKPETSLFASAPAMPATAPPAPSPPAAPVPAPSAPAPQKAPAVEEVKAKPSPAPSAPPTTTAPPEPKLEKPVAEEKPGERRRPSQGKGPDRQAGPPPAVFQGLSREKAMELLYWRDMKQSGLLFGSVLLLLFSLTQFSVVSVVAYLALAALSASISFRVYKSVLQAVQKTDEGHPFKAYLDMEISLSQDQMQKYAENVQSYLNSMLKELRRLFLVQDLVDSLKFAVLMWLLTYVGALFNGLTLLIMAVVSMFSMPVVYEKYQAQIDQYMGLIRTQVNSVVGKIQEKIPGAKRKAE